MLVPQSQPVNTPRSVSPLSRRVSAPSRSGMAPRASSTAPSCNSRCPKHWLAGPVCCALYIYGVIYMQLGLLRRVASSLSNQYPSPLMLSWYVCMLPPIAVDRELHKSSEQRQCQLQQQQCREHCSIQEHQQGALYQPGWPVPAKQP